MRNFLVRKGLRKSAVDELCLIHIRMTATVIAGGKYSQEGVVAVSFATRICLKVTKRQLKAADEVCFPFFLLLVIVQNFKKMRIAHAHCREALFSPVKDFVLSLVEIRVRRSNFLISKPIRDFILVGELQQVEGLSFRDPNTMTTAFCLGIISTRQTSNAVGFMNRLIQFNICRELGLLNQLIQLERNCSMYAAVGQAVREIVWVAGFKKHKQANTTAAVRNCTVRNLMMIHGIQYKFTDAVADVSWCVFAVAINVKEQSAQLIDIRLTTDTFSAQRFLRMERIDGEVDVGRGIPISRGPIFRADFIKDALTNTRFQRLRIDLGNGLHFLFAICPNQELSHAIGIYIAQQLYKCVIKGSASKRLSEDGIRFCIAVI